jgi:hypothetical protein
VAIEIEVDKAALAERVLRGELALVEVSRSGDACLRIADRTAKPALVIRRQGSPAGCSLGK